MRKSKEHSDVYWFPSQSESTPVPLPHVRDFIIVRTLDKTLPSLSIQDTNNKPPRTTSWIFPPNPIENNPLTMDFLYPQSGSQGQNLTNLSLTILKISCNQFRTMLNFV